MQNTLCTNSYDVIATVALYVLFLIHAIVNISSGSTRLIRRKCSLNRSKCIGTNHVIVYPRFCYYINLTIIYYRGAGLSPRDIHCFCLTTSFTYDIEERGCVSANVSGLDFHSGSLVSEARRPAEQQSGSRITRRHKTYHWPTASIFTPMFHIDDISGEPRRNGTGFLDAFKLTKLTWTVTLVIIIGR